MPARQIYGSEINLEMAELLTLKNEWSYAALIGALSNIYMKAHASSVFRCGAYKVAIIINEAMLAPYRGQPESSYDRLVAIVERMLEPDGGILVGIFVGDGLFQPDANIGLKHCVSQCWPLENKGQKQFITANLPPPQMDNYENRNRYFKFLDLAATRVDYNTPVEQMFNILERSRVHVCYQGGTAWLSVSMGIPTIIVHPVPVLRPENRKSRLFGQELGVINILNSVGQITHVSQHPMELHCHIDQLQETLDQVIGAGNEPQILRESENLTRENAKSFYSNMDKQRVSCPVCGSDRHQSLLYGDRYGMNIHTVGCCDCGMIFVNPRPTQTVMSDFYRHDYRKFYESIERPTSEYIARGPFGQRAKFVVKVLKSGQFSNGSKSVLDIGCGEGTLLKSIKREFPGVDCFGLEPNPEFAEYARQTSGSNDIFTGDFLSFFQQNQRQYNLITLTHVLEHQLEPLKVLRSIHTLLAEDGIFYLEVPNIMHPDAKSIQNVHLGHLMSFSPQTLHHILAKTGFEVTRFYGEDLPAKTISMGALCVKAIPHSGIVRDKHQIDSEFMDYWQRICSRPAAAKVTRIAKSRSGEISLLLGRQCTGSKILRSCLDSHANLHTVNEILDDTAFEHFKDVKLFVDYICDGGDPKGMFFPYYRTHIGNRKDGFLPSSTAFKQLTNLITRHSSKHHVIFSVKYHSLWNIHDNSPRLQTCPPMLDNARKSGQRIVHLTRHNVLENLCSILLSSQTQSGIVNSLFDEQDTPPNLILDPAKILWQLQEFQNQEETVRECFQGYERYLEIDYDDLFDEAGDFSASVLSQIATLYDVAADFDRKPVPGKMGSENLTDVISNYDEIADILTGSEFEYCLTG